MYNISFFHFYENKINLNRNCLISYSAPTLSTAEGTSQKSSEQVTSPINESLPEPNLSDSPASNLPKRKILRPRATQKDVEQTSHSKTKSRKRNIFTEDEADEDERER